MPFPGHSFDPELAKLITRAISEACQELSFADAYDGVHARTVMALDLVAAVDAGERDSQRLKFIALDAVDCRVVPDGPGNE